MTATVIALPTRLPDTVAGELLLHEAAALAHAHGLHLVIDRNGQAVLTPILLPGMQRIAVLDKQLAAA